MDFNRGLPPGLRGYVAADMMAQQRGMNGLSQLSGLLQLQGSVQAQQEAALTNPLRRQLLQAQVDRATRPTTTQLDAGDRILFLDENRNVVGEIPKGATPDTALREGGADRRHAQPSGNTVYSGNIALRGQDMTDARTRAEGAANRAVTVAGQNRPQFSAEAGGWVLPPQIGGQPAPQYSPGVMGAFGAPPNAPQAGVIPVPGMAPKPRQTPGQNATDQAFAKEYVDFKAAGGYADIEKNLGQLSGASKALATDSSLTGPFRGMFPDSVRTFTNPNAVATKELVQEVAQRNLRLILGAQFTEKEGERLIARVYNDRLPPEENKRRVDSLMTQIRAAAQAKQSASDYFERNGTLAGWQGALPKLDDFMPKDRATDSSNGWSIKPIQ